MAYTDEQKLAARAELARRELARRQQSQEAKPEEDSGEYLDSLPEEGFLSKLPRNIAIGGANLAQSTANIPSDIARSIEQYGPQFEAINNKNFPIPGDNNPPSSDIVEQFNKLHNVPESMKNPLYNKPFSERIPHLQEHDFAKMFGQQGEPSLMDTLIQKGIEYAPAIAGGRALIGAGLKKFPITKGAGTRRLKEAENIIQNLGIKTPIHGASLYESEQYLPKTLASREMLGAASKGEYSPSFALQSQLGHHQRNLAKSVLPADRLIAPEVHDLRQNILSQIDKGLREKGHHDVADLLKGGIDDYRKYKKFNETIKPIMKKLKIPGSLLALLGFGVYNGKKIASKFMD